MICKWCNNVVQENTKFCPHCGRELNGMDSFEQTSNNGMIKEEKVNVGWAILSWFIPLAGLIIFLVKKDNEPKTAKVSGICALISFILSFLLVMLIMWFTFSVVDNVLDDIPDINQNEIIEDNIEDNVDKTENNNIVTNNESTNNWKSYEIIVNNQKLTLPITYDELTNLTGFTFKSSDLKSYLESGYYTLVNMYKNDKLSLYVEVLNDSSEDMLYTDCKITRVSQTKYQVSQGANVVTFPGGLKAGDEITEDKIIELFGTPNDVDEYSSDGYVSKTYKYVENTDFTTTNNFEIDVVNGVIDQIQLDNRYYND